MTRVAVSGSVLRWALERSGRASGIERKFPKLAKWLKSESQPTLLQLEHLAKTTSTPLGYFFLSEPSEERLPIPHFRMPGGAPTSRPSSDLLESYKAFPHHSVESLTRRGPRSLPSGGVSSRHWRKAGRRQRSRRLGAAGGHHEH